MPNRELARFVDSIVKAIPGLSDAQRGSVTATIYENAQNFLDRVPELIAFAILTADGSEVDVTPPR